VIRPPGATEEFHGQPICAAHHNVLATLVRALHVVIRDEKVDALCTLVDILTGGYCFVDADEAILIGRAREVAVGLTKVVVAGRAALYKGYGHGQALREVTDLGIRATELVIFLSGLGAEFPEKFQGMRVKGQGFIVGLIENAEVVGYTIPFRTFITDHASPILLGLGLNYELLIMIGIKLIIC